MQEQVKTCSDAPFRIIASKKRIIDILVGGNSNLIPTCNLLSYVARTFETPDVGKWALFGGQGEMKQIGIEKKK